MDEACLEHVSCEKHEESNNDGKDETHVLNPVNKQKLYKKNSRRSRFNVVKKNSYYRKHSIHFFLKLSQMSLTDRYTMN